MKSLIKMLHLELMFFKLSAIADLNMRFNLFVQFMNDVLWYSVQIVLFEALYLHVDELGGWTIADTRVFLGLLFLIDGLHMVFFAHNFDVFSEKVAQGDMELMLLKPVSTQHLMSCQRLQCGYLLNVVLAASWLGWSLSFIPGGFSLSMLAMLALVIPAGFAIFYSTRLLFITPALLYSRAEHITEIYFSVLKLGMKPDRLYGPGLRYLILMIIPVGMIASIPTRLLVEPFDVWLLASLLGMAGLLLLVTNRFWHWSVKRYCSDL